MVLVKVAVFIFILLSVFIQLRTEAQPTINSFEENSCSQLEEEWRIRDEEIHRLEFEYKWQRLKTLENFSQSQFQENQRLNVELENERQRLKTLENVSHSQFQENQRLNVELENERKRIKTLENVSRSQFEENQRLNVELENEQQNLKTLKSAFHSHCDENQRLNVELEKERQLLQNSSLRRATVRLIKRIYGSDSYVYSVIKILDEIYVLCHFSNSSNSIKVFEDRNEFRLRREIALSGTNRIYDMVYSNESKCFYIQDFYEKCIWGKNTEGDHRLAKWLRGVSWPHTLSLSSEGHLMVLRSFNPPFSRLDFYSLSADLIRSIQLPHDVVEPRDVVQTSAGYYVILHKLNNALNGSCAISQVNSAGQLMNRFTPRNQFQVLTDPRKLFYDSDNNRLFVPDYRNHRVILFDSNCLNWIQVLLSRETEKIWYPTSVFFDAIRKQLFVLQSGVVYIYELI